MPLQPPRGSARRPPPPGPPRAIPWARVALPSDSLGLHMEPLRPSKARTTLAPRRGTEAARPPATPSAAGCAGAFLCRCWGVHRRRPALGAAARQGGHPTAHAPSPRGPHPVKGPHGTSHKPPRGARRLVEVAVQTPDGGRPPAAAMRECASDARRGREGHTQGAVPTPCG